MRSGLNMEKPWHKFYPEGIPFEKEIPSAISIFQLLEKTECDFSSRIAVIDGEQKLTFCELKSTSLYLASALFNRGFKKG